jgi:hypothetical protein
LDRLPNWAGCTGRKSEREGGNGLLDDEKDIARKDTELEDPIEAKEENKKESGILHIDIDLTPRLPHIHIDDNAEIIKNRDQAGQDTDDDERDKARPDGRAEDIELGQESRSRREPGQRQ